MDLAKMNDILKVAIYLKDDSEDIIKKLINDKQNHRFLLPVVGEFSSGKSKLINNLLGENILPTKTSESTSYLTKISYSTEPKVLLNDTTEISFEELKKINNVDEYKIEGTDIEEINVYLDKDILKTGLILVDTPGINTINKKVENFTYNILPNANFLMFVIQKSISKSELDFLRKISSLNIDLIIVRTKIDEFNGSEESLIDSLNKEQDELKLNLNKDIKFFPISNNISNNKLFNEYFERLKEYIKVGITESIDTMIDESINNKMSGIVDSLKNKIQNKKEIIIHSDQISSEKIENDIAKINEQICLLNSKYKSKTLKVEGELSEQISIVNKTISKFKDISLNNFSENVGKFNDISKLSDYASEKAKDEVNNFISSVNNELKIYEDQLIKKYENLKISSDNFVDEILKDYSLNLNLKTQPIKDEIDELSDKLLRDIEEKYLNHLKELNESQEMIKNKINNDVKKIDEINRELPELQDELELTKKELKEYDVYTPKYIDKNGDKTISKTLKDIGKVLDFFAMFIPVEEEIEILSHLPKFLQSSEKVINYTRKVEDGLNTINQARSGDVKGVPAINKKIQDRNYNSTEENEQFRNLNLLSMEFFMENFGKIFDEQPRKEIDRKFEIEFYNRKHQLEYEFSIKKKSLFDKINDKNSTIEEKKMEEKKLEITEKIKEEYEQALESEKERIKKKVKDEVLHKTKDNIIAQFYEQFTSLSDTVKKSMDSYFEKLLNKIILASTEYEKNSLLNLNESLNELKKAKSADKLENEKILTEFTELEAIL